MSRETIISETQNINIEQSEKVSPDAKKKMQNDTKDKDKDTSKSQPKLVIKIPLPFALGYITINLGLMLGKLVKGLAAGVVALLLAKIANVLTELLADKLSKGGVSQKDIDAALSETDVDALLKESMQDYDVLSSNNNLSPSLSSLSSFDANSFDGTGQGDGTITDEYSKANSNKKKRTSQVKYSIDKRNRKDTLDSSIVSDREGSNNKNIKTVKNNNYGVYLD